MRERRTATVTAAWYDDRPCPRSRPVIEIAAALGRDDSVLCLGTDRMSRRRWDQDLDRRNQASRSRSGRVSRHRNRLEHVSLTANVTWVNLP